MKNVTAILIARLLLVAGLFTLRVCGEEAQHLSVVIVRWDLADPACMIVKIAQHKWTARVKKPVTGLTDYVNTDPACATLVFLCSFALAREIVWQKTATGMKTFVGRTSPTAE